MAKTTAPKNDNDNPAPELPRHPREVSADLSSLVASANAQGVPVPPHELLALVVEFADSVAATYEA